MPVATAGNSYLAGIHRQSNEATVGSVAAYTLAVYESTPHIEQSLNRIEVTDAAAIQGDPTKGPSSWTYAMKAPAYAASLGTILGGMWPVDTNTGPDGNSDYTHAFSGVGGTQPWMACFGEWPNAGTAEFTFGKGLCTSVSFEAASSGGPLTVGASYVGQEASYVAFTVTAADDLTAGFFEMQKTGSKIEIDLDSPNANPSTQPEDIRAFSLSVNREVTPEPVVDSFQVTNLGQGKVTMTGSMEWLYTSWDAYRATYFGAVAGTTASSTIVYGALELTAMHSVDTNWSLKLYIPKVAFHVGDVTPDAAGGPLVVPVTMEIAKPTSGDHIQPTLLNGVSASYD